MFTLLLTTYSLIALTGWLAIEVGEALSRIRVRRHQKQSHIWHAR